MSSQASPARLPVEVDLPAVPEEFSREIRERVEELDAGHGPDVVAGGPGRVPRIRRADHLPCRRR